MDKKKKMIIIISIVMVVIIIGAITIFMNQNKTGGIPKVQTLELSQVMELENIEKSRYEIEQNEKLQVSSKYIVMDEIYEVNANIEFGETLGKMIYIREEYQKSNIYQTEYELDKYEDINMQIEEMMNEFEELCKGYLNIEMDEKPVREELYGEVQDNVRKPIAESIYNDNKIYNISYEKEEKVYDINFYRDGEKIKCEFAYNID